MSLKIKHYLSLLYKTTEPIEAKSQIGSTIKTNYREKKIYYSQLETTLKILEMH